jgi:hypothetical protein
MQEDGDGDSMFSADHYDEQNRIGGGVDFSGPKTYWVVQARVLLRYTKSHCDHEL